ncbi:hypothetical protein B0X65_07850 [Helicobacter pylori]|nr:hypothetical protein [Helicobacter pylori]OOQ35941.1 hypothetical protein B0X65_07850 [Helicobacter pylori]PDW95290.1 hypothetical protein BB395_06935 [Helicobacter pylori]
MFYRFSSHFVVKIILLKFRFIKVLFYFLEDIESALKLFSLLQPTTKIPQKKEGLKKKGFKKKSLKKRA